MENFSERLKRLRKSQNVTQKELAQALNVTERNYQSWEAGKTKPQFDTINALCDHFHVSADYLLGRTDTP
jgi:transcriptional regulator with XRE-family HTH domain